MSWTNTPNRRTLVENSVPPGRGAGAVDAGPFLAWLDRWRERQDQMRTMSSPDFPRPVASLEDLAALADISARAFSRARQSGRVSHILVDRVLVAAGGDTPLSLLYPELYD
jgi:hypothetical protein